MKFNLTKSVLVFLAVFAVSCAADQGGPGEGPPSSPVGAEAWSPQEAAGEDVTGAALDLEEIAEIERAGGFYQGLALTESGIRENAGDYGGAVIAAYKALAWSYAYGGASMEDLREGLGRVLEFYRTPEGRREPEKKEAALRAAEGTLAFLAGRWDEAEALLGPLAGANEDPDAFPRWMLLVCNLEKGAPSRTTRAAYSSIRGRYGIFPEYWYRGARAFDGIIAAEYAERCINLSPRGPFAGECRDIILRGMGLPPSGGGAFKSRAEIEELITRSAAAGEPELLSELFPLISLPDNAYTHYALGALRALTALPQFRNFFLEQSGRTTGRLAERLAYISRG